jgi:hypothetical protein
MWSFSWHYEGMKEDALQKGLPAPDEAVVRELVLAKNVEAPDLVTVKDFFRFHAAAGKGTIVEQTTCDSLNTFAEWFFASENFQMSLNFSNGPPTAACLLQSGVALQP